MSLPDSSGAAGSPAVSVPTVLESGSPGGDDAGPGGGDEGASSDSG